MWNSMKRMAVATAGVVAPRTRGEDDDDDSNATTDEEYDNNGSVTATDRTRSSDSGASYDNQQQPQQQHEQQQQDEQGDVATAAPAAPRSKKQQLLQQQHEQLRENEKKIEELEDLVSNLQREIRLSRADVQRLEDKNRSLSKQVHELKQREKERDGFEMSNTSLNTSANASTVGGDDTRSPISALDDSSTRDAASTNAAEAATTLKNLEATIAALTRDKERLATENSTIKQQVSAYYQQVEQAHRDTVAHYAALTEQLQLDHARELEEQKKQQQQGGEPNKETRNDDDEEDGGPGASRSALADALEGLRTHNGELTAQLHEANQHIAALRSNEDRVATEYEDQLKFLEAEKERTLEENLLEAGQTRRLLHEEMQSQLAAQKERFEAERKQLRDETAALTQQQLADGMFLAAGTDEEPQQQQQEPHTISEETATKLRELEQQLEDAAHREEQLNAQLRSVTDAARAAHADQAAAHKRDVESLSQQLSEAARARRSPKKEDLIVDGNTTATTATTAFGEEERDAYEEKLRLVEIEHRQRTGEMEQQRAEQTAQLESQLAAVSSESQESQKRIQQLLAENDNLQQKSQHELFQLRAEIQQTAAQKTDLEQTISSLTAQLQDAGAHLQQANEQQQQVRKNLDAEAVTIIEKKDSDIRQLQSELGEATRQLDEANANLHRFQGAVQELEVAKGESEKRLEQEKQKEVASLSEELAKAREAAAQLQQRFAQQENAFEEQTSQREEETQLLHGKISSLQAQVQSISSAAESTSSEQVKSRELQEHLAESNNQLTTLQTTYKMLQTQFEDIVRGRETDKSILAHGEANINTLTATNRELSAECHRLREESTQLHQVVLDALLKTNVQIPAHAKKLSDNVTLLVSEFLSATQRLSEAEDVQKQWARTYEQAKTVNERVNDELRKANSSIRELSEDLSLKEMSISRLNQQAKTESTQSHEFMLALNNKETEAQGLASELVELREEVRRLHASGTNKVDEAALTSAQHDADEARKMLMEKEQEATELRKSLDNLQLVLETFQAQKSKDVEDRTRYLSHEVDSLKAQIASQHAQRSDRKDEVENLKHEHRKVLAAKTTIINGLQNKVAEMRKALEETVVRLNDDQMIDKRIVSHLLVNYISSTVSGRDDGDDIVKVMSGLLNWDEETMQRAGMIDGPLNPRPPAESTWTGALSNFFGAPAAPPSSSSSGGGGGAAKGGTGGKGGSLAELWVDFLIKESEANSAASSPTASDVADAGRSAQGHYSNT